MNARMPPRLSLDLLRGFRAAARHLSFTRAAHELSVTQPAISREIKALEDRLGQPLFRRVNRTLQLTHAGEELYRAADEALTLIDATDRTARGRGADAFRDDNHALASLWLVPRLPQFTRRDPELDVRLAASNDAVDLGREHLDLAIRYLPPGADIPGGEWLVDYKQVPVCSPRLDRDKWRRIRDVADLAQHTLLDFETVLYGRPWYDWERWTSAMKVRVIKAAGMMRFSHYDQVIQSAIEGSGVAIGKLPHLARHLRDGLLCAPLGRDWVAPLGSFHIVVAPGAAQRDAVASFVGWLREVTRDDARSTPVPLRDAGPSSARPRSSRVSG
jgi:DNA-binding transcriptional LysR family regulator